MYLEQLTNTRVRMREISNGNGMSAKAELGQRSGSGTLVVVGSGIQFAGHATLATERAIRAASRVFFAVADPWAARWVRSLNATAESLPYPSEVALRRDIYALMVEKILQSVRAGEHVCAVFYGSPAVLTQPAHAALRQAQAEGWRATMLPGVSFLECLFNDAGIDPGERGCHFVDASVFVKEERLLDVRSLVVLSQIGFVTKRGVFQEQDAEVNAGLELLAERLLRFYQPNHLATLYEAARSPLDTPRVEQVRLSALPEARVCALTTLYLPPVHYDASAT
jgi:uncharacterized protein YabN with tetrapyrrole methylase and pyrophosphatase domain